MANRSHLSIILAVLLGGCAASGGLQPGDIKAEKPAPSAQMPPGRYASTSALDVVKRTLSDARIKSKNGDITVIPGNDYLVPALHKYCTDAGGVIKGRYVPGGLAPYVEDAFKTLPLFSGADGKIIHEYTWCTGSVSPLFAYIPQRGKGLHILEGPAMARYITSRVAYVNSKAEDAKQTLAGYILKSDPDTPDSFGISQLTFFTAFNPPYLTVGIYNSGDAAAEVETGLPLLLYYGNKSWVFSPAIADNRLTATVKEAECVWDEYHMILTIPPESICSVNVKYSMPDDRSFPFDKLDMFFGGAVMVVSPLSLLETGKPELWCN